MLVTMLFARVATRFLQLVHNIGEGREAHAIGDILPEVDVCPLGLVGNQVFYCAVAVAGHLLYDGVTFRVYSGVVEWILCVGNTQETGTLLIGGGA